MGPRRVPNDPDRPGKILDAALQIATEEGTRRLTHRTVARRAGVPVGSVSYYFPTVDGLIVETFRHLSSTRVVPVGELARPMRRDELVEQLASLVVGAALLVPATLMVACMFVLPFAGAAIFSIALAGIGFLGMMYFAPCTVSPGEYPDEISPRDYGTALGLVLTLGNAGAIVFPYLYGRVTEGVSPTAGWLSLAIVAGMACCALLVTREPRTAPATAAIPQQQTAP